MTSSIVPSFLVTVRTYPSAVATGVVGTHFNQKHRSPGNHPEALSRNGRNAPPVVGQRYGRVVVALEDRRHIVVVIGDDDLPLVSPTAVPTARHDSMLAWTKRRTTALVVAGYTSRHSVPRHAQMEYTSGRDGDDAFKQHPNLSCCWVSLCNDRSCLQPRHVLNDTVLACLLE